MKTWTFRTRAAALLVLLVGCKAGPETCAPCQVSADVEARTGFAPGPHGNCCAGTLPPDVVLEDGVTEDEAVAVALWNSPAYRELLAELDISEAQLLEAGLLTDPVLTVLFPIGPKQLEFAVALPVEALWLRPVRVRAAEMDLSRVGQQMVQGGLDVARDARIGHAELLRAQERHGVAVEIEKTRTHIAELTKKRLARGDISELETTTARVESLNAQAEAALAEQDVLLAQSRLKAVLGLAVLGLAGAEAPLIAIDLAPRGDLDRDVEELVVEALALRPDVRAAEMAVESAGERTGLARREIFALTAILDANEKDGPEEVGPGMDVRLPVFNRNRGKIALADAEFQRALRRYAAVRNQVALEVRLAHARLRQSRDNLAAVNGRIMPLLNEATTAAQKAYDAGGVTYFLVLETTGQYLSARQRQVDMSAEVRKSLAELERSVGRRLASQEVLPGPEISTARQTAELEWNLAEEDLPPAGSSPEP
ncbi:MAG: TolC family protein [Planctomycetia bacterium]|nr:TolC family protein [Planctomycetia bacterium]